MTLDLEVVLDAVVAAAMVQVRGLRVFSSKMEHADYRRVPFCLRKLANHDEFSDRDLQVVDTQDKEDIPLVTTMLVASTMTV